MNEYKQAVESLDDSVGQILDKLEEKNQLDNTLIVLTSDHGYMLGEHGMYGSGFMYEEAIQIPLVIRYPRWTDENGKNEQFESEALVTHGDVYNLIKTLNQETLNWKDGQKTNKKTYKTRHNLIFQLQSMTLFSSKYPRNRHKKPPVKPEFDGLKKKLQVFLQKPLPRPRIFQSGELRGLVEHSQPRWSLSL